MQKTLITQMSNLLVSLALLGVLAEASQVEVIVAHHSEDLSWLARVPRDVCLRIYTKGPRVDFNVSLAAKTTLQQLPNVGRESHTYLSHIVQNYESLADWSVFTQAGEPSFGYKGHRSGGGHLMAGDDFFKYLHPHPSGSRFVYTSAVHLPSINHLLRAAYCIDDALLEGEAASKCPKEAALWTPWWDVGNFVKYVSFKVESQSGENVMDFYHKYINSAHTGDEVIAFFPQGARFAVAREVIHRRPKADYERLLTTLSKDVDPYSGYFMEWLWSELFLGHQEPCAVPPKTVPVSHSDAMQSLAQRFPKSVERQLSKQERRMSGAISGGISGGVSGGISGGISGGMTPTTMVTTATTTTTATTSTTTSGTNLAGEATTTSLVKTTPTTTLPPTAATANTVMVTTSTSAGTLTTTLVVTSTTTSTALSTTDAGTYTLSESTTTASRILATTDTTTTLSAKVAAVSTTVTGTSSTSTTSTTTVDTTTVNANIDTTIAAALPPTTGGTSDTTTHSDYFSTTTTALTTSTMAAPDIVTKVAGTLEVEIKVQGALEPEVLESMFKEAIAQALGVSIENVVKVKVSEVIPGSGLRRLQEVQKKLYEVSYEVLPPSSMNPDEVVEKANRIAATYTPEALAFLEVLATTDGVAEVGQITSKVSAYTFHEEKTSMSPPDSVVQDNGSISPLVVGSIGGFLAVLCLIGGVIMLRRKMVPDGMKTALRGWVGGSDAEAGNPVIECLPSNTLLYSRFVQPKKDVKEASSC